MPYRRYEEVEPSYEEFGEVPYGGEFEEPQPSWGYAHPTPEPGGQVSPIEAPLIRREPPERPPLVIHPGGGYSEYERSKAAMGQSRAGGGPSQGFFIPSGRQPGEGGRVPGPLTPTLPYVPMPLPTMPEFPPVEIPPRSEERIESLTQRIAGPGLREARRRVREVSGKYFENPNVKRMTLREAMAGYGMGLERIMGGARREAGAEYEREYAPQVQKAFTEYQARANRLMSQYQTAWRDYLARMQATPAGAY